MSGPTVYFVLDTPLPDSGVDQFVDGWSATQLVSIDREPASVKRNLKRDGDRSVSCTFDDVVVDIRAYDGGQSYDVPDGVAGLSFVSISADRLQFDPDDPDSRDNVESYLDATVALYELLVEIGHDTIYGFGVGPGEKERLAGNFADTPAPSFTVEKIHRLALPELYWIQIFPEEMAESIGRQKFETAPVWRTVELTGGGVLLVRWPNPHSDATVCDGYYDQPLAEHLGISAGLAATDYSQTAQRVLRTLPTEADIASQTVDTTRFAALERDDTIALVRFDGEIDRNSIWIGTETADMETAIYDPETFPALIYPTDSGPLYVFDSFACFLQPESEDRVASKIDAFLRELPAAVSEQLLGAAGFDVEIEAIGNRIDGQ